MEIYHASQLPHAPEVTMENTAIAGKVARFTEAMEGEKGFWNGFSDVLNRGGLILSESGTCIANLNIQALLTPQEYKEIVSFKTPFRGIPLKDINQRLKLYYIYKTRQYASESELTEIKNVISVCKEEADINAHATVFFVQPRFLEQTTLIGKDTVRRHARLNLKNADKTYPIAFPESAHVEEFVMDRISSVRRLYGIPGEYSAMFLHPYDDYFNPNIPGNITRYLSKRGDDENANGAPLTIFVREKLAALWGVKVSSKDLNVVSEEEE